MLMLFCNQATIPQIGKWLNQQAFSQPPSGFKKKSNEDLTKSDIKLGMALTDSQFNLICLSVPYQE
jgi:hypothetical protein